MKLFKMVCAASLLALPTFASAPAMAQPRMTNRAMQAMIARWPNSSRMAAMDMMRKYGPPQEMTPTMLMWRNNGPWKWTKISNMEVPHSFPMPHPDVMQQAINYRVPLGKYDNLARYDGSVIVERTKGELSARCDKEGANFLAVNLAHDVASDRRTVDQARDYYTKAIMTFKQTGRMDPYMMRLQFQPPMTGADPDRPTM